MKKRFFLIPTLSIFFLAACDSNELPIKESSTHTVNVKDKKVKESSESKEFKSVNDYINKTMAQQFSFLSFEKSIKGNTLVTKVVFSVDNIVNPKFKATSNEFYWSIQLPSSLFKEIKQTPKPVVFKSLSEKDLSKYEKKKSRYSNYYEVEQRFKISNNKISKVKSKLKNRDSGFAFKIHDENKEDTYVFIDLESFVNEK